MRLEEGDRLLSVPLMLVGGMAFKALLRFLMGSLIHKAMDQVGMLLL